MRTTVRKWSLNQVIEVTLFLFVSFFQQMGSKTVKKEELENLLNVC